MDCNSTRVIWDGLEVAYGASGERGHIAGLTPAALGRFVTCFWAALV
jgi:hypothetical protein